MRRIRHTCHLDIVLVALLAGWAPAQAWQASPPEEWELVEELRIGRVDDPELSLTGVSSLAVGADGTIYVGQPVDRVIRVYSPDGALITTIGRDGEGPGEFRSVDRLGWRGDTLWVRDGRLGRLSFFAPDGTFLDSRRIVSPPLEGRFLPTVPHAILADGSLLVNALTTAADAAEDDREPVPLLRLDARSASVLDTIALLDDRERVLAIPLQSGVLYWLNPFDASDLWAASSDGRSVVLVQRRLEPDRVRVTRFAPSGDTIHSGVVRLGALEADRQVADSVRESMILTLVERTETPLRVARNAVRQAVSVPRTLPPVPEMAVGRDGSVWLRAAGSGDPSTWLIVQPDGGGVRRVETPGSLRILEAEGTRVWGVEIGELDIPQVVRYGLQERTRSAQDKARTFR